jgi:hypothetical protein
MTETQAEVWIEEEANKRGMRLMAVIPLFLLAILALPLVYGIGSGLQFLRDGFTFQAGLGWWSVSVAVYALVVGILATTAITIDYRLRGQIVKVGFADSGVWLCTRRVSRLVPWGQFVPGGGPMPGGRNYFLQARKPNSGWRISNIVLGPRSGAAIIADPRFPRSQ